MSSLPRHAPAVNREATLEAASRLMREHDIEELVVADRKDGAGMPMGFISARDIVMRVVALGLDPAVVTAGDLLGMKGVASPDDVLQALAGSESSGAHRIHR
jgi:CBS domain-containing protein